jgi:hypothetical protein
VTLVIAASGSALAIFRKRMLMRTSQIVLAEYHLTERFVQPC